MRCWEMAGVSTITDGGRALEACDDLFRADPIGSNMVASVLRPGEATRIGRVHEGNRTLGAIVDWPPGWTITRLLAGAHDCVAIRLPREGGRLWGEAADVLAISQRWSERTNGSVVLDELMRTYRLGDITEPAGDGELAPIEPEDATAIDRAARWATAFAEDIGHARSNDANGAIARMRRAAHEQRLYVWRHQGGTVAQLLVSPQRFGVVRIGGVYTPPEHRNVGHASALTAAMSTELRRQGVHEVTLLTQASNATTNRLYRRLGFTHVYDTLSVELRDR